ncbi:hypothetical protein TNIN_470741 [Trichonephila inaurata madagascariensis]|uniref:Uncharacterized protein n=1 Tax=Trichonephila inaurata madagascariensis TaxID=2747483 RepID=A0A8X6XF82_9ARAC|nr:hypothetical protein TNIN_470741 [Trichonephila inaurata madagascariensis]
MADNSAPSLVKRASWNEICSKIEVRTNKTISSKSLSRDRSQVKICNTILTADGFSPNDDRATANILGSHYQKMSRLTFNKADKHSERQGKLAIHKCRSSDPVSMEELLLAFDLKKSPDNIILVQAALNVC